MSNLGTQIASILNNSQEITFNIEIGCESVRQLISQYDFIQNFYVTRLIILVNSM